MEKISCVEKLGIEFMSILRKGSVGFGDTV